VKYHYSYLNINQKKGIEEVWIVCEYLRGGTLSEAARKFLFKDAHIAYFAKEMCKGIKHLHDKQWAHRDLKSANVMLQIDGGVKLIDFGLAADMSNGEKTKMLGSAFWIPPEMIRKEPHTLSADIWSLAVCMLEFFYQSPPYSISPLKCMFEVATVGLAARIPDFASSNGRDWLSRCLVMEQSERATIDELLAHPWLNKNPEATIELIAILNSLFLSNTLDAIM